jgi:hypothetical protein
MKDELVERWALPTLLKDKQLSLLEDKQLSQVSSRPHEACLDWL